MILVLVVSLFTTRITLHALGIVDYGISNVVAGFVSMFSFLNASMSNGIQRFYNFVLGQNKKEKLSHVYTTAIHIQFLLAIVLIILLETFGIWYMYNKMVVPMERFQAAMWLFQSSVLSMVVVVMQIPFVSAIMAYERMDFYAYVSIFDVFAKLGVAYGLLHSSSDRLVLYGIMYFLISFFSFLLYYIYSKRNFCLLRYQSSLNRHLLKEMLSFSGWNICGTFAYMLKSQGLNLLLNAFFGPIVNAARGISGMILSAIQGFQSNIVIAFRPQLVQSYASNDQARVRLLFYSLTKVSFWLLTALSIPVILELKFILDLWLDDVIPDYTYSFTVLVLLNMIISSLNTPISQVVHATGKMRTYQLTTSFIICGIIPVAYIFLKLGYDPNSVYVVSLILTIINQVICNIILKRIFPYSLVDYCKHVICPLLFFCIISPLGPFLIIKILPASLLRFIIASLFSILVSIVLGYFIVLNHAEKLFVNRLALKKIKRR